MSGETEARRRLIEAWAEADPRIRHVLVSEDAMEVAVAPCPVADSDETLPVWMAHCDAWHRELIERTGRPVRLDWLDPDNV